MSEELKSVLVKIGIAILWLLVVAAITESIEAAKKGLNVAQAAFKKIGEILSWLFVIVNPLNYIKLFIIVVKFFGGLLTGRGFRGSSFDAETDMLALKADMPTIQGKEFVYSKVS